MGELSKLPNIGERLEEQLLEIGIESYDKLKETGSRQAWLKIKEIDDSACINRLCALEGAIQGIRWHDLSEGDKINLRDFYKAMK
ncbi:DNA transformation protein [Mobilisporobacter senegalensis]|uniref:DNA transformation protein n=1 Tax=Mobilisporobacter senegalensis TaxID=1329262 RepID=A0A3N1XZJ9_9FIRM|nr:TfoX/Sxy family protein [Mobilisporobacter senegalensis]ROR30367.1 DNA transformation protein [Mobilisporobacter senegalensis]